MSRLTVSFLVVVERSYYTEKKRLKKEEENGGRLANSKEGRVDMDMIRTFVANEVLDCCYDAICLDAFVKGSI